MAFNPHLEIGHEISNDDVSRIFACGNMGGMRRSLSTNTLVLISDYTKGLYHDKWIAGILHYTGMGQVGDQSIDFSQNKTLANSKTNGVNVHLFEVMEAGRYTYCGVVQLVSAPYQDVQPDSNNMPRKVWMFPIRPTPDNDVKKPELFTFQDIEEYNLRGKVAELQYAQQLAVQKKPKKSASTVQTSVVAAPLVAPPVIEKPSIPADLVGKNIKHTVYGVGTVTSIHGDYIVVSFPQIGEKKLSYNFCVENSLIKIL